MPTELTMSEVIAELTARFPTASIQVFDLAGVQYERGKRLEYAHVTIHIDRLRYRGVTLTDALARVP